MRGTSSTDGEARRRMFGPAGPSDAGTSGLGGLTERLAPPGAPVRGRPRVTVSYAQSLDGSIAARPGEPLRLSGSRSLALTHRLRAAHDAILVGIGTVLADDPRLSVRFASGRSPAPVVLDSRLRLPLDARLVAAGDGSLTVAATEDAPEPAARRLEERGVTVLRFPGHEGRVPLRPLLRELGRRGVRRLLVEGGGQVLTSVFAERLADWAVITVAPRLVGGEPALARAPSPVDLGQFGWARVEDDLVIAGRPRFGVG